MKQQTIEQGMSYEVYRQHITEQLGLGKTTGTCQSEELVEFTQLNEQRMNRNEKQFKLDESLQATLTNLEKPEVWIIFVEAWCGDCAQNVPIIAKIAASAPEKIDIHFLIKSEHIEDFQQHLTNGSESIPKLIRFDKESLNELGSWGARPEKAQAIAEHWKKNKDSISKEDFEKELHLWYAKDRGQELQKEFVSLLKKH
jgi:hypothetical protein